jgi:hypothetical protein
MLYPFELRALNNLRDMITCFFTAFSLIVGGALAVATSTRPIAFVISSVAQSYRLKADRVSWKAWCGLVLQTFDWKNLYDAPLFPFSFPCLKI